MPGVTFFAMTADFMPHGHCYFWTPSIMWTHAISDFLIALSYLNVPAALLYFVKKRSDLVFKKVLIVVVLCFVSCSVGHITDIWNIWNGDYFFSAFVRAITAVASVITAVVLWRFIPTALAFPTTTSLEEEVKKTKIAEEQLSSLARSLEDKVEERTRELTSFNSLAVHREEFMIELKKRVNELCLELEKPPEHDLSFLDK